RLFSVMLYLLNHAGQSLLIIRGVGVRDQVLRSKFGRAQIEVFVEHHSHPSGQIERRQKTSVQPDATDDVQAVLRRRYLLNRKQTQGWPAWRLFLFQKRRDWRVRGRQRFFVSELRRPLC